nr:MAG: hypothetical protein DIU80_07130 [Chloroflexota bacterium]
MSRILLALRDTPDAQDRSTGKVGRQY